MLVIRRRAGESLVLAGGIRITVLETHGGAVKIGIEAPAEVSVYRAEVLEEVVRRNRQAAAGAPDPGLVARLRRHDPVPVAAGEPRPEE